MSNNGPFGSTDPQGNNAWDLSQAYDNNAPSGFSFSYSGSSNKKSSSYHTIRDGPTSGSIFGDNNNFFSFARCDNSNPSTFGLQSFDKFPDEGDKASLGVRNSNLKKDKMPTFVDSVPKLQERKTIRADLKVDNLAKVIKNESSLSGQIISNNEVTHSIDDITNPLKDIRSYLLGRASTFQAT